MYAENSAIYRRSIVKTLNNAPSEEIIHEPEL